MAGLNDDPFEDDVADRVPGSDADDSAGTSGGDAGAQDFDIVEEIEEEEDLDGGDAGDADDDADSADDEPEPEPAVSAAQTEALKASINTAYINIETRKLFAEQNLAPIKAVKEQLEGNLEKLRIIKKEARQAKDRDRADDADDLIEQTQERLAAVAKQLEPLEKTVGEYDAKLGDLKSQWDKLHEPAPAAAPAEETAWRKRNAWFKQDGTDEKSVYAKQVAMKLFTEDKIPANSAVMWREVDRQLRIKFPDMRVAKKPVPSPNARPKPGSTASSVVAAGTGARSGAGNKKLTVPKGLKETWLKRGYPLSELSQYAVKD